MCEESIPASQAIAAIVLAGACFIGPVAVAADYQPITPDAEGKVITLTGHDLTIEQVIEVARHGAQVKYSPDAVKNAAEARDLRAEAGAEDISVYGLNRGSGALREVNNTPDKPADTQVLAMLGAGALPEIPDEDLGANRIADQREHLSVGRRRTRKHANAPGLVESPDHTGGLHAGHIGRGGLPGGRQQHPSGHEREG